jgi:hypothetical protein
MVADLIPGESGSTPDDVEYWCSLADAGLRLRKKEKIYIKKTISVLRY